MPLLRARFVQNTNWAGQKKVLDDTIAHVPAKSFIRARDTSMLASYFTIIFEYDKDTLGSRVQLPHHKRWVDASHHGLVEEDATSSLELPFQHNVTRLVLLKSTQNIILFCCIDSLLSFFSRTTLIEWNVLHR